MSTVHYRLDGRDLDAFADESILQSARRHGIDIPHLCHKDGLRPDGNCRACVVEIHGERALAPSCCRKPTEGMEVHSHSARARHSQRMVLELLRSEVGDDPNGELRHWCEAMSLPASRFVNRAPVDADRGHPAISVQMHDCIQCGRCLRACRETQGNDVIGFAGRGATARIVFDLDDALADSSCVACGECVQACPTLALSNAAGGETERRVASVCPYCGVGCQIDFHVSGERIVAVSGRDGPANHGRLCVKGRYGFDYVHHPDRLTIPLIRRDGAAKRLHDDPGEALADFREASWEEALELAAGNLSRLKQRHGASSLAGFGSAKGSNEEAYLFQKLVRTGFGSNHVDHCTRLCHASSVAALLQMIGSGAVSNPVADVTEADVIVVIGSNTTENHPVAATFMKNAARAGKTLIFMDPRRTPLARHARYVLQFNPDTDVAMLNAIMHSVIQQKLTDKRFISRRTRDFKKLEQSLQAFSPEEMAPICGIPAETLHEVARVYAASKASMIFWGMGISQHVHGTDNARCLINLALMTGQIGRPGTGLHPLRGQNNVQGASDAGLIPMVFPDYQRVDNDEARGWFEDIWGTALDPNPGLTVVEIMHAIHDGQIRGMYIMGENPAMSDPNLAHAREALSKLEHLVVQDIFLTETAQFADVVLPASAFPEKSGTFTNTDRRVQLGRKAIDPPGQARPDLDIVIAMAGGMGLDWQYDGPRAVFKEMRLAMPSIAGITWDRLEKEHAVTYPCRSEGDPGEPVIFTKEFPTTDGRARFVPTDLRPADELPDEDYPLVLITGRQLEHWHTGAMTRRASALDALEPQAVVSLHPLDMDELGVQPGNRLRVSSRRGQVEVLARSDAGLGRRQVFLPFCYHEAAANLLTNEALDPDGKIPEFKYCAVKVEGLGVASHSTK
ncbi:MAG: formate dehydrogenase subunit alpha [Chromatiales bacterium]|nr:formate dehydrogenase subunit alpha [Chromatiales bacterium]